MRFHQGHGAYALTTGHAYETMGSRPRTQGATEMAFKPGDKVRASFMISGEIVRIERNRGIDIAIIFEGSPYNRQVPVSNLTKIEFCENATIIYDLEATPTNTGFGDRYPVKNLIYCRNAPEIRTRRGTWFCKECGSR
jgi:hypothetical protein